MKIVFLINSLEGGGAERVVSRLAARLAADDHELLILTLGPARPAYPLPDNVPVRELRSGKVAGAGGLLALPLLAMRFRKIAAQLRPDVVVSFLVRSNIVHTLSTFGGRLHPVILSERVQARRHYTGLARPMRALVSRFYPRADAVIAISESVKESLVSLGMPAEIVHVIYNPMDFREATPKRERSPMLDQRIVQLITVGRLVGFKEQHVMIRALQRIRETCDARLTIVGDGPLRRDLESLARELGVAPFVTFTGWRPDPYPLLAAADIFLFSSRYEAFGNVILEAMACGVPIVSTDCPGGPREMLEQGRYGVLVPVGDSDAMAGAVVRLIDDAALYERLREAGIARVRDFDVPVVADRYLQVFREVIDARKTQAAR